MKKIFQTLSFLLLVSCSSAQNIIYVSQAAIGGQQNGATWADAFTDLQDALFLAEYGDAIWVASGIYYPTSSIDRTILFNIKNGISILGGFIGTETSSDTRNPLLNPTRLSGNIGDTLSYEDNSIHVARGYGLDENTVISGLIFSDGYSVGVFNEPSDSYGAGFYLTGSPNLANARPIFSDCIFEKNWAGGAGGGLCIYLTLLGFGHADGCNQFIIS